MSHETKSAQSSNAAFEIENDPQYQQLKAAAVNAQKALQAAITPLAIIVITEKEKPYAEHGPGLKESIQKANDAVLLSLVELNTILGVWFESLAAEKGEG